MIFCFFFSSRRRHTRLQGDWSSDVCSSDLRWTAAEPTLRWLRQNAVGLAVTIEDVSEQIAALALQGPTSAGRSEERRVGKEGITRWRSYHKGSSTETSRNGRSWRRHRKRER